MNEDWDRRKEQRDWMERIEKKLDAIGQDFLVHCEADKQTRGQVSELRDEVYGNGKKGLKEDVTILKNTVSTYSTGMKMAWTFITGLVISVITIVINFIIKKHGS